MIDGIRIKLLLAGLIAVASAFPFSYSSDNAIETKNYILEDRNLNMADQISYEKFRGKYGALDFLLR